MRAQEALLKTGVIAKEMREGRVRGNDESMRTRIVQLDSLILALIADLDQRPESLACAADLTAILNLWGMARFLAYT